MPSAAPQNQRDAGADGADVGLFERDAGPSASDASLDAADRSEADQLPSFDATDAPFTSDALRDAAMDAPNDNFSDAAAPEAIHYYGRWNRLAASAITVNSGSHVVATFHGTGISAKFDPTPNTTTPPNTTLPNLTWQIDGGPWKEGELASTLVLATGLAAGSHEVRLMVRGLNAFQSRWTPPLVASVTFVGFEVTAGAVDPTQRPVRPKLEFLGDSITEGMLVHLASEVPQNTPAWLADARLDYACQTALALNVEWRQVGFGGQGIANMGVGGIPVSGDTFNFFYAGVPRDGWQADMVVVNQGTNDSGASSQVFRAGYAAYLRLIRAAYPNASIVALRPFNGAHSADIEAEIRARAAGGDSKVFFVDTNGWITASTDTTDGLHPNAEGHTKVTTFLVDELRKHL
jgi:hypothetical protein